MLLLRSLRTQSLLQLRVGVTYTELRFGASRIPVGPLMDTELNHTASTAGVQRVHKTSVQPLTPADSHNSNISHDRELLPVQRSPQCCSNPKSISTTKIKFIRRTVCSGLDTHGPPLNGACNMGGFVRKYEGDPRIRTCALPGDRWQRGSAAHDWPGHVVSRAN